ncbi:MAG: glycosyltransferase family 2 protein [Capsulimonadaceae bacterium]|nr:glycosyltransferase family 2 protein [Capsulimonadaceae bacterium]
MQPDLHISIVSFNTSSLLDACLASIFSNDTLASLRVAVADNGSTDGSVRMVRDAYPQVCLIETGSNMGYGRANNAALLGTDARYCLILNSDTVVQQGAIDALVAYMDAHSDVGAAGAALLEPDGSPQMNWAAGELTLSSVVWEQSFLAKLFPRSRIFGDYFRTFWTRDGDALIPQACGAALIVRAGLFNELGGFDPAIYMYAEDTDLCKRIRERGLEIGYVAGAHITHYHGQSSVGSLRPAMIVEHNRARIYYFLKHSAAGVASAARLVMVAGALLRALIWSCAALAGRKEAARAASSFLTVACATAFARIPRVQPGARRP